MNEGIHILIMACIVHYEGYVDKNECAKPLDKKGYERLLLAATYRSKLGGGNCHEVQSSQIPKEYIEGLVRHTKCYKKFTSVLSSASVSSSENKNVPSVSRVRRSGDTGRTILPKHCIM